MTTLPSITTSQLSRITGLHVRTLQKWHRKGIAPATVIESANKTQFVYSEDQAYVVLVLADMQTRKMKWKAVLLASEQLRRVAGSRYLIGSRDGVQGVETDQEFVSTVTSLAHAAFAIERAEFLAKLGRDRIPKCRLKTY